MPQPSRQGNGDESSSPHGKRSVRPALARPMSPAVFVQTLCNYRNPLTARSKTYRLSTSGTRNANLVVLSTPLISHSIGRELVAFLDLQILPNESTQALAAYRGKSPQGLRSFLVHPDRYYRMALFISSPRWRFLPTLYHIAHSTCYHIRLRCSLLQSMLCALSRGSLALRACWNMPCSRKFLRCSMAYRVLLLLPLPLLLLLVRLPVPLWCYLICVPSVSCNSPVFPVSCIF